jgi:hypothetical protein
MQSSSTTIAEKIIMDTESYDIRDVAYRIEAASDKILSLIFELRRALASAPELKDVKRLSETSWLALIETSLTRDTNWLGGPGYKASDAIRDIFSIADYLKNAESDDDSKETI